MEVLWGEARRFIVTPFSVPLECHTARSEVEEQKKAVGTVWVSHGLKAT